jgi:hypothetical protein
MADGSVRVAPDSTGKIIDTSELTVSAQTVERQRVNIADPAVAAAIAVIMNSVPAGTEYGLVVRSLAQGLVAAGASPAGNPLRLGGNDGLFIQDVNVTSRGQQGARGVAVQDLKDAGRTFISFTLDRIAGVAAEALATMTINRGGTVTTGTSYTITIGKALRIQSISVTIADSTTTAVNGRVRLRCAPTAFSATSPIYIDVDIPGLIGTAAANAGQNMFTQSFPDGLELPPTSIVGLTQILSSVSSLLTVHVVGYEY